MGYNRERFGPAWSDVDHNGCDQRDDVLNRDLAAKLWEPGTHDCVVVSGLLADPYTGRTIAFAKADAGAVQIDHVVALSDAWQTGAASWDDSRRVAFANDLLDLLAVDAATNEAKSDSDAASWLPPNTTFRCAYVARQVTVKATWGLWVTPAEHDAIAGVLAACPGEPVATAGPPVQQAPPATSPPPASPSPSPSTTAPGGVYYPNCDAARAAGAAPLHQGDPGYRPGLDRDGDGIACE